LTKNSHFRSGTNYLKIYSSKINNDKIEMLQIRDIKAIEPGPRQLTFSFDTVTPEEKDAWVMSAFRERIAAHGHVVLTDFISFVMEKHSLSVQDILQSVFWAANELKLHFMIDKAIVSPQKARNILLNNSAGVMLLIDNRKAEASVFKNALSFYQMLMPDKITGLEQEQYEFAIALLAIFKDWKAEFKYLEPLARKPYFPGSQTIEKHLQFLKILLAHQDSCSIINNAYNKRKAISEIKAQLDTLSLFYKLYAERWEFFIRLLDDLNPHFAELKQIPEAFQDYQNFTSILKSSGPWDMISEAELVSKNLEDHKNRIIQTKLRQKRIDARADINAAIEELTQFLDSRKSDMNFRNKCLYPLQKALSQVEKESSLNKIDDLVSHLEDMADDVLDSY
jgi:hypothetical protein